MRWRLQLSGVVQGVGFRPFVYRLSRRFGLKGYVRNEGGDVVLEVQGDGETLMRWKQALIDERPAVARVDGLIVSVIDDADDLEKPFYIEESISLHAHVTPSPDLALCSECRTEISSKSDRRFDYPFTNCTNCGPRFTIISRLPYDRRNTSMSAFPLCDECQSEYGDPHDRRFHAEPVACSRCGPALCVIGMPTSGADNTTALNAATNVLRDGGIVGLKALGGWHLACDARNEKAVRELRQRKERRLQPFAVMFRDEATVRSYACLSEEESVLLRSSAAPIVLLETSDEKLSLAPSVHPETGVLGAMLPSTPLHDLLLRRFDGPLVMTSGNRCGAPTPYRDEAAMEEMKTLADIALSHDRPILLRCDDSIVRVHPGAKRPVYHRRARGYAPHIIETPFRFARTTFAAGSFLNAAFAFGSDRRIYLSPHLGDLDHPEAFEQYVEIADHYMELFQLHPELYVCDLHPAYPSTLYVERRCHAEGIDPVRVQHHEAHAASCLAEHHHRGPALALVLDGTGYGYDGTSWGGELLYFHDFPLLDDVHTAGIERCGSLAALPMPGADRAVLETDRMAEGLLFHAGSDAIAAARSIGRAPGLTDANEDMMRNAMHLFPKTSGCGRLFDAVSFLVSGRSESEYEGQPAIWLENRLEREAFSGSPRSHTPYPFALNKADRWIIDPAVMVFALLDDLHRGESASRISLRFHSGLVTAFVEMLEEVAAEKSVRTVALSGGCFFNRYLTQHFTQELERLGFTVLLHKELPPGDGGLAAGQLMLGAALAVAS
ncbi:MAG: carbamoyltransferase HypF [Leptonema illini]|uniref:Carbamoyltransferase n=1 Tax=Leptonema illini TaxID=183 RepID=A0A833LWJ9_9LEPT|nr:MAG: carbamoyltransferase HypF [Leptonema illini]